MPDKMNMMKDSIEYIGGAETVEKYEEKSKGNETDKLYMMIICILWK